MSQCRVCNSPDFVLDRVTGVMKCSSCGSQNYIGSPSSYTPQDFTVTKKGKLERNGYMDNEMFDPED